MITFKQKGNFSRTEKFFEKTKEIVKLGDFDKYGREGVRALRSATPIDTGLASESWYYEIKHTKNGATITWSNKDIEGGCNVAILIQYGHGNGRGGYVQGKDFINPAMKPVFDHIADEITKEVNRF